ncbi:MAG: ABC transporter permease [Actinomycetota bacterium]|nr:ABC transporter permease [Actinomycetota bacterium]
MSVAVMNAQAALAVMRRDFQILMSYRTQLISVVFGGFLTLTIFYYVSRLVSVGAFKSPDDYYAFVVVGIVILQMLQSVLVGPPAVLRQELLAGTFERIVLSPFGPVAGIVSMLLFPFVMALITGAVTLLFAIVVFGVDLELSSAPLAIPAAFLAGLAFAPFGVLLVAIVLIVKQAAVGTSFVIAAISLIAGFYFPTTLLPGWIEWASEVQPFTPGVDLLRHLLLGSAPRESTWLEVGKLVGFSAAMLPLSLGLLSLTVRVTRRRGTIIEY